MIDQPLRYQSHFPGLDGLRGIAILLVIFYHNYHFINPASIGWLGVDLFFVLSGFLITRILLNTVNQPNYLKNFYVRRMLRIFPLYYFVLFLAIIILPSLGLLKKQLQYCVDYQIWFWTYLQNWLFAIYPAKETHLLGHLWSLAVEEQFYIIWPLLVIVIKKQKPLLVVMICILLAVIAARIYFFLLHSHDFNYTMLYTFTRIDGLCIGSMVAILHKINFNFLSKNIAVVVIGLAGINFIFYFLTHDNRQAYPYYFFVGYTTFTGIFGLLVHEIVSQNNILVNKIFSNRLFRFFGKISYGLYVYHWPIYLLLYVPILKMLNNVSSKSQMLAKIVDSTAVTIIAIIISILSYHLFEKHFLRLKKKFA